LSPPFRASQRRAKNAVSKDAFKVEFPSQTEEELYRWIYCYYWYGWLVDYVEQTVITEAAGNPTHWYNTGTEAEKTRRLLRTVLYWARTEVPF
jgi:hypothetical protein